MLENFTTDKELKFTDLSPEEKSKRGILGRLFGPVASFLTPTRNERLYNDKLWEKTFSSPIVTELYKNGGIPGELDHPTDREETCSEKIAIMMPEPPTKDKDGHLIGYFDIIDTPCGRIAYALAKYGFKLGISSRGSGDVYPGVNGVDNVDEDSYNFNAFDLVLLPASVDARLKLAESFDINKKNFKKALRESLETSNEEDRKIMTDTLENLNIEYDESSDEIKTEETNEETKETAENNGEDVVKTLEETLLKNHQLEQEVVSLNEKLSVGYSKEVKLSEEITTLKDTVRKLSKSVSKAGKDSELMESLKEQLNRQNVKLSNYKNLIESYKEKLDSQNKETNSLQESLNNNKVKEKDLKREILRLNENITNTKKEYEDKVQNLNEQLEQLKVDSKVVKENYDRKQKNTERLLEKYKKIAKESINKYIESKANNLGINVNEIKNKLSENYSFNEIDEVCEELRSYKLNMNKLPFNIGNNISKITLHEDKSTSKFTNPDDIVDSEMLNIFNL